MEQVVIQFSADISKLLPAIEAFEQVGLLEKKNGDIFRQTNAEYQKRNAVLEETTTNYHNLNNEIASGAVKEHTNDVKKQTEEIERQNKVIAELTAQIDKLDKEMKQLESTNDKNSEAYKKLKTQADALRKTMKETAGETDNLENQVKALRAQLKDLELQGKKDTEEYKKLLQVFQNLGAEFEATEPKAKSLKAQLKEMKQQLAEMEVAGLQGTEAYAKLRQEAGKLEDALGDARASVKAFASDTRKVEMVAQSFKLITASVAGVQGAYALFGNESEDLQKTMLKLQGAMAIMASVTEMAEFATGRSALKTTLLSNAQKLATATAEAFGISMAAANAILTGGLALITTAIASYFLLSDAEENNTKVIEANTEARKAQRDAVRDLNNQIINAKTSFMKEKGLYDDYDAQIIARMDKQTQDLQDAERERGEVIQKITEAHIEKMFSIERHRNDARKDLEIVGGKLRLKAGADMGNKMLELIKKVNNDALATESSYLTKRNKINDLASLELITLETARDNQAKEEKKKKEEEASKKRADARDKAKQEQIKAEEEAKKISEEYAKSRAAIESSVLTQFEKDQKKRAQIAKDWNRSATEIDAMYNEIIQEGVYTTSDAIYTELEKRLQANADYYNQLIAEDDAAKKQLEKNMKTETDLMKKYNKTKLEIEALYQKAVKDGKAKSADEAYAIVQQDLADKQQAMDDEEAMLEEGKRQGIKIAGELAQWQLEASTQRLEAEFSKLDEMLEKQRLAILDNQNLTESQREATEKVFAERKRKLQIEQWKRQQQIAVNSAIINTALAIGNALATTKPFPAALIAAAGAAVSGGIQVAKIKSTPIPQFAEGTEFLEGAGTGTSDSIPAMLSRGERVVPARTNKDYFDGLSVIQNRLVAPELVNSLLTNLAENGGMLASPSEAITNLEREFGIDYERLGKEFRRGQTQVSINLDEKGFTKHITQGLNRSTYHNQKFRFKK